ncbi:Hypothetical predicted protein [Octopus vulgaris]|uniref:Uncharacterized protein n=1 Tax=Octopus vulgaris TaxID=6645 RepID=A0AA36BA18_OCTVU|nr:Hypothetical predicted protein [Octopus vulgaris]
MDAGSYDNVEFPIRKPVTTSGSYTVSSKYVSSGGSSKSGGVGGGSSSSSSTTISSSNSSGGVNSSVSTGRIQVHHANAKVDNISNSRQTAKLATVEEGSTENEDGKTHSTVVIQNNTLVSSTTTDPSSEANISMDTLRSQSSSTPYMSPPPTLPRHQAGSGEQFDRRDLTPSSQALIDNAYTDLRKHHRLNQAIDQQGADLKDQVCDMCRKPGESVSYEQLLQGMLVEGERLLLTGNWLYFTNVEFLDSNGSKTMAQPLGNGRACLTSRALLLLCAEGTLNSTVRKVNEEEKDPKKQRPTYHLDVRKFEQIYYRSVPLTSVRSVELNVQTGTSAETTLTMREALCCGLCRCFGFHRCNESWKNSRPRTVPISRRTVTLGVNMPPWGLQTTVVIHLLPEMSVVVARDLVASLQTHAPALSTISTL